MAARIRVSVAKLLHADGRLSQLDEETAILNHLFSIVFTDEESSYIQRLAKQEVTEELSDFTVENIREEDRWTESDSHPGRIGYPKSTARHPRSSEPTPLRAKSK